MKTINNWRGESIEVFRSKGGTLVVVNPWDNLVRTGVPIWPPLEIVQKLYQSRQVRAFDGPDREAVTRQLGYYSDLQSLHSEDAITWSVFGTLLHCDYSEKIAFVNSLFNLIDIPTVPAKDANIWLWRRVPHPDTLVSGGPEIDFGIQTEHVLLLGEAKWLSKEGKGQGKSKTKSQIALRREFFEKYGAKVFGDEFNFVVLGVSLKCGMVQKETANLRTAKLFLRETTWEALCHLNAHPVSSELISYLNWKITHSKNR